MRGKPLALVAAALVAAAGLFLLWRALGAGTASVSPPTAAPEPERRETPDAIAPAALEASEDVRRAADRSTRAESFPVAQAEWIAGRVVFPDRAPPDETVEVWAFEVELAVGMMDAGGVGEFANAPDIARRGELEKGWWSRRAVEADGSFRVPLPKDATKAMFLVDGRYLFLEELAAAEVGKEEALVLRPALGAWIVGRCTLPANAEPADAPVGAIVSVGEHRRTPVGADLSFEVRGAPPEPKARVAVRPARLASGRVGDLRFDAGAKREVEIALRFGGRVSGRVVDDQGTGLAGATVAFESQTFSFFGGDLEDDEDEGDDRKSGPDGSFELFGLPEKGFVRAELEGFLDGATEPLRLPEGEVVRGITIELSRGHRVAGSVSWPDGAPAVGAKVTASTLETLQRGGMTINGMPSVSSATTDGEGKFAISGLGDGPTTLFATCWPPESIHPEVEGENLPTWYALLEDVPVNSEGLSLVLRAPVGLAGRVIDDLGQPVAKFDAHARAPDDELGDSRRSIYTPASTHVEDSKDGSFRITGLQEGRWAIEIEARGYVQTEDKPVVEVPHLGDPVIVRVERAGSAAGVVLDPEGSPVAEAVVNAQLRAGTGGLFGDNGVLASAITDAKGAFVVENLRAGTASLVAQKEDQASSEPLPIMVEPAQRLDGLVLRLRRGGRLTGEVFDKRGAPAAGREIQIFGLGGSDHRQATTDDAGAFAVESLSPGSYQVMMQPTAEDQERLAKTAEEGGEFDVASFFDSMKMTSAQIREGETTHVVLGAPPRAPVRVFGRVTRAGEPVSRGHILCLGEGGPVLSKMKMATVSDRGDYELVLDEPGEVQIAHQASDGSGGESFFSVSVPEAAEFRFDLALPTGGIRGVVRGADGRALADIEVGLRRSGSAGVGLMSETENQASSDEQGAFEFLGLATGTYAVTAGGRGMFDEDEAPRFGRAVAGGLVVPKDEILAGVELRLAPPGRIAGTVRDASGAPIADANVFARDERGQAVDSLTMCRTESDGTFTYLGVAPGKYTIFARTATHATAEGTPGLAREGETSRVDLVALPGTILNVSFEDREGRRLRGSVSVRDERGREMTGFHGMESLESMISEGIDTRVQRVGPLPPGEYQVSAIADDGRSDRKTVQLRGQEERSVKLRAE